MNDDELQRKKEELLKMLDEEEPFDKEKYDAEMKAMENTMWEWAAMEYDGSISVRVWEIRENGRRGDGGYVLTPNEDGYMQNVSSATDSVSRVTAILRRANLLMVNGFGCNHND